MSADNQPLSGGAALALLEETSELITYFKKQVQRGPLRENLRLTPAQRMERMQGPSRTTIHEAGVPYGPGNATSDLVDAFKKDVDRTLLIENLKLTPAQRIAKFVAFMEMVHEVRRAGAEMRKREAKNVSRKD